MLLKADQIKGCYGIICTPSTPGADHWSAVDTVDTAETSRLVGSLVDDGCTGVIALGTTGEVATLTESEFRVAAEAVVRGVAGRVPTIIGATALGTHQTIERLKFVQDLGATGTMLGLPMWQPCTEDMAVRFYAGIAEAFPDLTVMIYMNVRAFRFDFPVSFWERVVDVAPNVTCAKYGATPPLAELVEATRGRVKFLVNDMAVVEPAMALPDHIDTCWATAASMGPRPIVKLMDAVAARDWETAKAIDADIKWSIETFFPPKREEFGLYNIQLEKLRMQGAGYCNPGPIRPPYDVVPEDYAAGALECGRRWKELVAKYA